MMESNDSQILCIKKQKEESFTFDDYVKLFNCEPEKWK